VDHTGGITTQSGQRGEKIKIKAEGRKVPRSGEKGQSGPLLLKRVERGGDQKDDEIRLEGLPKSGDGKNAQAEYRHRRGSMPGGGDHKEDV